MINLTAKKIPSAFYNIITRYKHDNTPDLSKLPQVTYTKQENGSHACVNEEFAEIFYLRSRGYCSILTWYAAKFYQNWNLFMQYMIFNNLYVPLLQYW